MQQKNNITAQLAYYDTSPLSIYKYKDYILQNRTPIEGATTAKQIKSYKGLKQERRVGTKYVRRTRDKQEYRQAQRDEIQHQLSSTNALILE